jgi:hypothetical protein
MSINYSPELVKVLMDDRIRAVRRESFVHCCLELLPDEPARSIRDRVTSLFRRQSPAACIC